MRLPNGVEWLLHSVWLLALVPDGAALSTHRLAEFYGLPEAYLAKLLKALVRAGVLEASTGPRGGFRLARCADEITVLQIVDAVDSDARIFHCAEIRQRGPAAAPAAACRRPCGIAAVMHEAERAWRMSLASTTVADLADRADVGSVTRAHEWLARVPSQVPSG